MSTLQKNDNYIGQLLIREGVINQDDLIRGLKQQEESRDFLCSTLVKLGMASEERIYSILSLQIGIPYLSLQNCPIDPLVVNCLPGKLSQACGCLVFKMMDDTYYVAMSDPLNTQAIEEVKGYLGTRHLKVFLTGDNELQSALRKFFTLPSADMNS